MKYVKLTVKIVFAIMVAIPTLLWRVIEGIDELILNQQDIPARKVGESPYDHIIMRHTYVPHSSLAMRALAGIDEESETPPWLVREQEKADGRQVVPSAWVSAANVREALEPTALIAAPLTAHGFLGMLKANGAYLHAESRPTEEVVQEFEQIIEEKGIFVVEEPQPQPEKRRVRRAKLVTVGVQA